MTRNLALATLFMLASVLVLGYSWIAERGNLAARAATTEGVRLSRGARDYEQYCARCHGLTGEGIIGPRINFLYTSNTINGTTVATGTLVQEGRWEGENQIQAKYGTVRNYVEATLISGIRGAAMPAWSNRVGGPLRDDQIQNITDYILSWNGQIPASAATAAADYQGTQVTANEAVAASNTPLGRGKAVFARCAACHQLGSQEGVGPGLGGLWGPDGTAAFGKNLPNGKPVDVANWKEWVLAGGGPFTDLNGKKWGVMPPQKLTEDQLNDLLAYTSQFDRDGKEALPPLGPDGNPLPADATGTDGAGPAPTPTLRPAGTPGTGATVAPGGTGPGTQETPGSGIQPGATSQPTAQPGITPLPNTP